MGPAIEIAGRTIELIVVDADTGVMLFLALSSLGVYSLVLAGYSSNNKYSLIGSIRASAQMISYELALTLSVVAVLLPAGSLRLTRRRAVPGGPPVARRDPAAGNVFPQALGFLVFLMRCLRRDQPAAVRPGRGRVGAGGRLPHRVQRDALRALLHGRVHVDDHPAASASPSTSAAGRSPAWPSKASSAGAVGFLVLLGKVALFMLFFVWVRWTYPRFRYDQLMRLGWKVLLPLALVNFVVTAAMTVAGWL